MRIVASLFAAALLLAAPAPAATTWGAAAGKVCASWKAKAKADATLGKQPATIEGAYRYAVKSRSFEAKLLAALTRVPGRTARGSAALAALRGDIAEVDLAIADWKKGDQQGFLAVINRWGNDHRPAAAFRAAGSPLCAA